MPTASQIAFEIVARDKSGQVFNQVDRRLKGLSAPAVRLNRAFDQLAESSGVKTFARGLQGMTRDAGKLLEDITGARYGIAALAGGLSAAGMAETMRHAAKIGSNLHTISVQSQMSVPHLMRWGNVVAAAGGNAQDAMNSMSQFAQTMDLARRGLAPNQAGIISAMSIPQMFGKNYMAELAKPAEQQMKDILDRVSRISDPAMRNRIGSTLVPDWQDWSKVVQDGNQKLKDYERTADSMVTVSDQNTRNLNELNQAFTTLNADVNNTSTNIEGRFAPAMTHALTYIDQMIKKNPQLAATLGLIAGAANTAANAFGGLGNIASNAMLAIYMRRQLGKGAAGAAAGEGAALAEGAGGGLLAGVALPLAALAADVALLIDAIHHSSAVSQGKEDAQIGGPLYTRFPGLITGLPGGVGGSSGGKPTLPTTAGQKAVLARVQQDLKGMGYTPAQIAGVSARMMVESGLNPGAWGDNHTSYGLPQWHGPRLDALKQFLQQRYHTDLAHSTVDEQMAFWDYEMRHGYAGADRSLRAAKTPAQAYAAYTRDYENPAHVDQQIAVGAPEAKLFMPPQAPAVAPPQHLFVPPAPPPAKVEGGLNARIHVSTDKGTTARVVATGSGAMQGPPQIQVMPTAGAAP